MKVLVMFGREPSYTRNAVIVQGLLHGNHEIIDCTSDAKSYPVRAIAAMSNFLVKKHKADVILVGFFGQPLIPLVKLFSKKPVVFDAFISAYQTLVEDRKRFKKESVLGRFWHWLDVYCVKNTNVILLDSNQHIKYFKTYFGGKKYERLFVGADTGMFDPHLVKRKRNGKEFVVFYYGQMQKLHGIDVIVKAAKKVNKKIKFVIVGKGEEKAKIKKLAKKVPNITLIDWVPYKDLPQAVADADVCLGGHFGPTKKARLVISGKTFQFLAMGKPTIVGKNKSTKELLQHNKDCLMVDMENADQLAKAITKLYKNKSLRTKIAKQGKLTFEKHCTPQVLSKQLTQVIKHVA